MSRGFESHSKPVFFSGHFSSSVIAAFASFTLSFYGSPNSALSACIVKTRKSAGKLNAKWLVREENSKIKFGRIVGLGIKSKINEV